MHLKLVMLWLMATTQMRQYAGHFTYSITHIGQWVQDGAATSIPLLEGATSPAAAGPAAPAASLPSGVLPEGELAASPGALGSTLGTATGVDLAAEGAPSTAAATGSAALSALAAYAAWLLRRTAATLALCRSLWDWRR